MIASRADEVGLTGHDIATAKTVRTFLIAETIAITASSFFLLPSSFCYMAQKPGSLAPARPSPRKNPPTLDKSYSL